MAGSRALVAVLAVLALFAGCVSGESMDKLVALC
jgi:hypothetical protein